MHRFQFDPASVTEDNVAVLSSEESRHALKVLRLKPGDVVELLDGKGKKFRGVIASTERARVTVSIDQSAASLSEDSSVEIILAQAVIRPERMEILIQKACELGAARIVPLLAQRSIVKLSSERWEDKIDRWKKIAAAACKQCGRARIPEIALPTKLPAFLRTLTREDFFLFPTLAVPGQSLRDAIEAGRSSFLSRRSIVIAVGPEGDFTLEETRLALTHHALPVTLGRAVLRSETAALYLLSVIQYALPERV